MFNSLCCSFPPKQFCHTRPSSICYCFSPPCVAFGQGDVCNRVIVVWILATLLGSVSYGTLVTLAWVSYGLFCRQHFSWGQFVCGWPWDKVPDMEDSFVLAHGFLFLLALATVTTCQHSCGHWLELGVAGTKVPDAASS